MWVRKHYLTFILLFSIHSVIAQGALRLNGVLLCDNSDEPIPYASITDQDSTLRALTNVEGKFSIDISQNIQYLTFSCLGYTNKTIFTNSLSASTTNQVRLIPKPKMLNEVVFQPKTSKQIRGITMEMANPRALSFGEMKYSAFAIHFKVKENPFRMSKVNLHINKNPVESFILRCRVMNNEGNRPGKDLIQENIVKKSTQKEGWVSFDLTDVANLITEKKIFIVIEIFQEHYSEGSLKISTPGFSYNPTKKANPVYISTEFGKWRKSEITGLIANIETIHFE